MEEEARIIKDATNKIILAVTVDDENSTTLFNEFDTLGNQRVMSVGMCSSMYPDLVFQGYNVDRLEEYMINNNIPIPTP